MKQTYTRSYETYGNYTEHINHELSQGARVVSITPVTLSFVGGTTAPGVLIVFER